MPTQNYTNPASRSGWTYNQSDVDTLREHIQETERVKRRWLFLLLLLTAAALVGAIVWLSTNFAMYAASEAEKKNLAEENAGLKAELSKTQKDLAGYVDKEKRQAESVEKARQSVGQMLPGALGGVNVPAFAKMVYDSPNSRVEMGNIPPSTLFRNWKMPSESGGVEVYTLVGGNVGGKWVIYSNLISRQAQ
jgi:cell division protein FtsB